MATQPWIVKPLILLVGDSSYQVDPVEYDVGLTLLKSGSGEDGAIAEDAPDEELFRLVMGPVWDEMKAARVPYPAMFRAGAAATQYQFTLVAGGDMETAVAVGEQVWNSGIDPKMFPPQTAAAPAVPAKKATSKPSKRSAAAGATPSRASTSTTRSQPATPRTATAKRSPRSPGKTSPGSGR